MSVFKKYLFYFLFLFLISIDAFGQLDSIGIEIVDFKDTVRKHFEFEVQYKITNYSSQALSVNKYPRIGNYIQHSLDMGYEIIFLGKEKPVEIHDSSLTLIDYFLEQGKDIVDTLKKNESVIYNLSLPFFSFLKIGNYKVRLYYFSRRQKNPANLSEWKYIYVANDLLSN